MLLDRTVDCQQDRAATLLASCTGTPPKRTHQGSEPRQTQVLDGQMRSLDDVRFCLLSSAYTSIQKLDCQVDGDMLVIRGTVPSYYLKQLAQELVRRLAPPQAIRNLTTVQLDRKRGRINRADPPVAD